MLNEARFNFIKDAGNTLDNIRAELGPYTCANALYPGQCDKDGDPVGYYSSVTYTTAQVTVGITSQGCRCEKYVTGADTLTLTSGNHTFKFGTDSGYRGFSNTDLDFNGDGEYTIANGTSPFNPAATAASVFPTSGTCTVSCYPTAYTLYGHPGGASPKDSGASVNSPDPYMSLFAQDSWKIKDNLTLNYGLRYDLDLGNQYVTVFPGLNAMTTDFHDFQPRMGFAWTPFHDNDRTVIRGGSGLYYNEFHGAFAAGVNNVNPPSAALVGGLPEDYTWAYNSTSTNPYCQVAVSSGGVACGNAVPAATEQAFEEVLAYALATYTVPNFNPNGAVGAGQTFTITMPNGGPTYAVPAITQTVPPFQLTVDPNYKSPGAVQSSIGLQHQFSNSLTVSADFGYLRYFSLELMHNSNVNLQGQTINPSFGLLKSMQYNGKGSEYTLRAKVTYQDHRGDSLLGAYGLGYAWDNSVGPGSTGTFQVNFNSAPLSTNPFNPQRDWGPSNSLPVSILNISGAIRGVYGIQLSPIIQFNTGLRLTPTTSARSGPLVSACPAYFNTCYPAAPYDTKNQFVGDSFFTAGGRLSEKLKLGEKYAATLMFEGYNINNRRNISSYSLNYTSNGTTVSSTFGNPTGAGPSRQLQAGFQFDF
jgi:hypothetical protein